MRSVDLLYLLYAAVISMILIYTACILDYVMSVYINFGFVLPDDIGNEANGICTE